MHLLAIVSWEEQREDEDIKSIEDKEIKKQEKLEALKDHVMSPIKKETHSFEAEDPLIEVNLGIANEPRLTKVSGLLDESNRDQLV